MEKPNFYQVAATATLALATYFAKHEFESIKAEQRSDKAQIVELANRVQVINVNVAVLLERTPPKPYK